MKKTFVTLTQGDYTWRIQTPETKDVVYHIDMTPCDNMDDYMPTGVMPRFVEEDTPQFDEEDTPAVVQVATKYGWAIVAKWFNYGSTRIYALRPEVIIEAVAILSGTCDSGYCKPAYGTSNIECKEMSKESDKQVFRGVSFSKNVIEEIERA